MFTQARTVPTPPGMLFAIARSVPLQTFHIFFIIPFIFFILYFFFYYYILIYSLILYSSYLPDFPSLSELSLLPDFPYFLSLPIFSYHPCYSISSIIHNLHVVSRFYLYFHTIQIFYRPDDLYFSRLSVYSLCSPWFIVIL